MEGNAVTRTQARDADGNPLMSLEELKENMFQSIRDTGTVELIRAQLRRRFIEKLQQQRTPYNDRDDGENDANRVNREVANSTADEKLVHGLVAEFLATKGLENTLAVFVPEIGGSRNQVDGATILEEMERANTGHSLLLVLVQELVRRFQRATMDSGTQTAMDCFDHRIVLENQLRRVENTYLAECAAQKLEPQKSLEERMVQYQREYDDICEKRLQEELERFKSTEVALVRAEERKRFDREVDTLRSSLLLEYHKKQERIQERERELELAFVARRTELETSLFETRQSLFKDMERLRVKEAELQVKVESDFRHFASETQRFQLWEESVRTQEANLGGIVTQAIREKERSWQIEKQKSLQDIQAKQDELADREQNLTTETGTLKTLKTQVVALQQEVTALEAALSKSDDELRSANNLTAQLEKDRLRLEERIADIELQLGAQTKTINEATADNARLAADRNLVNEELFRYKQKNTQIKDQVKLMAGEVKALEQQVLKLKLDEATAIVSERKKFMQQMDEERDRCQWKENELLAKVREMQSRLAESEAAAEKYQSQFEDEKVHVESLRHDVASLNSLLTQAQATINAKHGAPRDVVSLRALRSAPNNDTLASGGHGLSDYPVRGGSERTFMMKMMEMMSNFQDERAVQRDDIRRDRCEIMNPGREESNSPQQIIDQTTPVLSDQPSDDDQEAKLLKEDQTRIERDLMEKREYEKKRQARIEEQERELAEQNNRFEEKLARMRQERIEEEEILDAERKRKQAEEEAKLQADLARRRTAIQEAEELQQKLADQRLANEQQRLQEEQAYREKQLADERKFNDELEARRQLQMRQEEEAAQQKQREVAEEQLRLERKAFEEQERIRLAMEQEEALVTARQKQEDEVRKINEELRLAEKEAKRKEEEEARQTKIDVADDEASWQESSVASDGIGSVVDDPLHDTSAVEITGPDADDSTALANAEENLTNTESTLTEAVVVEMNEADVAAEEDEAISDIPVALVKTEEENVLERQKEAEEAKKQEDENVIDVYRQRVLARKAADNQRQLELEAAENERKAREEEERVRQQLLGDDSESDHELELSAGSFAESSDPSSCRSVFDYLTSTMPAGNDGRAVRRPLPRQLDMSGWSTSSSSSMQDRDRFGKSATVSRDANNFDYSKAREPSSRHHSTRDKYQSRHTFEREDSTSLQEERTSRIDFDERNFTSGCSTSKASTFDSAFTSMPSRRKYSRENRPSSSPKGGHNEARSRHDNQSEGGSRYRSAAWNDEDELPRADHSAPGNVRPSSCRNEPRFSELPAFPRGAGDSFVSQTSLNYARTDNRCETSGSGSKADSIREAESPMSSPVDSELRRPNGHEEINPRNAPQLRTSSLTAAFENQDELHSPTNSEASISPSSPDSVAQRLRDRYPKPSNLSPTSSDKTTTSSSKRMHASSPCSSVSTDKSSASKRSAPKSKFTTTNQRPQQSAMTDLREDLYAFRKQMREVFIRVEDMVDVHRSFFKSDPSTGSPVLNDKLHQEAEQLANKTFKQLADLRHHFTRVAKDFQRSEEPSTEWTPPRRSTAQPSITKATTPKQRSPTTPSQVFVDDDISAKHCEVPEGHDSDAHDRISIGSNSDGADFREQSSTRSSQSDNEDVHSPITDSVRSTASTYLSSQLPSRWRDSIKPESIGHRDSNTRARDRSSSITSEASSLPDQRRCSAKSSSDTDSIFQDFDKRMEEIRCSLSAIASGKTPRRSVATPPKFSERGAGSPIRSMMDAARTRSTLREATRISKRLEDSDSSSNNHDQDAAGHGSREAELRRLLQELNRINASTEEPLQ